MPDTSYSLPNLPRASENEEITKNRYITPVIRERFGDANIDFEYYINNGRIRIEDDGCGHRSKNRNFVDYLLFYKGTVALAAVEAKRRSEPVNSGYSQVIDYAAKLGVPFAYSTNGDDLVEIDMKTKTSRLMKIKDFPYADELWDRFMQQDNVSKDIESAYTVPYYETNDGKKPRYYQRIMVDKALRAILDGKQRILLVSGTGTGKTYIAFQLIWRLYKSGKKKRILYLADRNVLVDQSMRNDFSPFGNLMCKFDNADPDMAHVLYFSLYQQLQHSDTDYFKNYPRDFFDLVVVDECHRGSADADSRWRNILDWFTSATHVGLTATPKNDRYQDNSNYYYFGNPLYTYSLKQGIEDGFLAPYKLVIAETDIDKFGYHPKAGATDVDGKPLSQSVYTYLDFDRTIIVQERRETVVKYISDYMKINDMRFSKTIVFCENQEHAGEMMRLLINENADLVAENDKYIVRITSDDEIGKSQLDNFINPNSKYPVIAVTSQLLSTGVDAQTCELIVLDRNIGSMTEFKQIIGRGSRIKENFDVDGELKSKMFFTILDFRKNYEHFSDKTFDGVPDDIKYYPKDYTERKHSHRNYQMQPRDSVVTVDGVNVSIVGEVVRYLDEYGNLTSQNLYSCAGNNIRSQFATVDDLKYAWLHCTDYKIFISELFLDCDFYSMFRNKYGVIVDEFDIACSLAYNIIPPCARTCRTSTDAVKDFLSAFNAEQQEFLKLLISIYETDGCVGLFSSYLFSLPSVVSEDWSAKRVTRVFGLESFKSIRRDLLGILYK